MFKNESTEGLAVENAAIDAVGYRVNVMLILSLGGRGQLCEDSWHVCVAVVNGSESETV
jgi:hypothetical protein